MTQQKQKVIEWFHAGCDYNAGAVLYQEYGKNRALAALFPGRGKRYGRKLVYELCKSVGLDWKRMPQPLNGKVAPEIPGINSPGPAVLKRFIPVISDTAPGLYPIIIRRVISEYSDLYKQRGKKFAEMGRIPEDNSPKNMDIRAALLDEIKAMSIRMEVLYLARRNWEDNKVLPDELLLWPVAGVKENVDDLPGTEEGLKKLKQNLQNANSKDRLRLSYQETKKAGKENPMPPGPKRDNIEKRMAGRVRKIDVINQKLSALAN